MARSPAFRMSGLELDGGWTVGAELPMATDATGGNFSCCYLASHLDGSTAVLKALDFSRAFRSPDPPTALNALTAAYLFERDVLNRCRVRNMDRVVRSLGDGKVRVDDSEMGVVSYLLLENADGDLRIQLSKMGKVETAWKLRALHHIATGLQQLHSAEIAHQDLKPSNILIFSGKEAKLTDLGCASLKGVASPRDDKAFAGDPVYAPPELLYGYLDPDWIRRRLGYDAYTLGSMIVFMFTSLNATTLLFSKLDPAHRPKVWTGVYTDVLPYIREAFGRALDEFSTHVTDPALRTELKSLVQYLCDPDLKLRGHPLNHRGFANRLSLERFVSRLNLLARRAELALK